MQQPKNTRTKAKQTVLQKTAENLNRMVLTLSEAQLQKGESVNGKEVAELAKTIAQAVEISRSVSLAQNGDDTLHIIMDREDFAQ